MYGPCPKCLGFMLKKRMWYHMKYNCKVKDSCSPHKNGRRNIIAESTALFIGMSNNKYPVEYSENILAKFQNDEISAVCKSDETILKFGWVRFEKFGNTQNELIRQQMRQLARFLIEIKCLDPDIKSLGDCLLPSNFDLIISATKNLCGNLKENRNQPEFQVPSLALKIGHSLKKCVFIHRGIALRLGLVKENDLMTTRSRKLVSLAIQENQEICDRLLHLPRYETTKPSSKSEMLLYTKIFKDSEFASKIVSREVDLKNSPSNLVLRNELADEYFAPQAVSQCSLHENDVALQNTELELNMDKNMAVLQTVKYFDIEPPSLHYFKDNDTNSTCSEEIRLQPEIVVYQNEICETAENHYMHEKTANYNDISDDEEVPDPYATSDNDSEYIPTEEPSDSSSNNSEMPNKHSWCEALLKNSTKKLNEKKPANRINITNRTENIREKLATPSSSSDEETVKVSCSKQTGSK
ncbi:hypothetical protein RN001_005789 [Aquatica leii]|uniref:Uncharacterized protein n=1 Tax=Aquatica leii TaxID=1421715 RepID=A0AAN7Q8B6_9COLE|nr:hypothetical protein RN001_005789 [Aquatica leii]